MRSGNTKVLVFRDVACSHFVNSSLPFNLKASLIPTKLTTADVVFE